MNPTRFRPTSVPTFGIFTPPPAQTRPPMPPKIAQAQRRLQRNGGRLQTARAHERFADANPRVFEEARSPRIRAEDIAPKRREPSLAQMIQQQNELLERQNELLEAQQPLLLEILAHVNGGKSFAESQIDDSQTDAAQMEVTEITVTPIAAESDKADDAP